MQNQLSKNLLEKNDQPKWVNNAVVYQIFPDRFKKSYKKKELNYLDFKPWGTDPLEQGFQGGNLYGVVESLDYLRDFGINCIYFTPIFSSASNHRYHTYDYFQVDPLLGGNNAFDILLNAAHQRDIKIILDGVFNHCGRGFWAFHHVLENMERSPYKDWFTIHKWPLDPYPKEVSECGYSCWWNNPALPKFNHKNKLVCDYLLSVARFWLKKGIDGWRLDVPSEVPFDFWEKFRSTVKEVNPDAWIVGEIWGDARKWLSPKFFDGVMNYRIGWSTLSWIGIENLNKDYSTKSYQIKHINTKEYIEILHTTQNWYTQSTNRKNLNLLDSHDVPRALYTLKNDIFALKLALFILFLQPGPPCIYYGTECGLIGGKEPNCREPFPWKEDWKYDLRTFIFSLVLARREIYEIIKDGIHWKAIENDGLIGIPIKSKDSIKILINRSRTNWLKISDNNIKIISCCRTIDNDNKRLSPQSAIIYI
mgnify:CR=1 FL=1